MPWSGGKFIVYSNPRPFATPSIAQVPAGFFDVHLIPRETLHYSAKTMEEIMHQIDKEYKGRGLSKPVWKKYKSSVDSFDRFTPDPKRGINLQSVPVRWFGQYVKDIQSAIDTLIDDTRVPDTNRAYMARVFCNNTTSANAHRFNNNTKLINGISTPNGEIDALSRAQGGNWILTDDQLTGNSPFIGVDASGIQLVEFGPNGIETTDPNWPQSVIGFKFGRDIGGLQGPMKGTNRPQFNRVNVDNTSLGVGAGLVDYDQGYGYLGHLSYVVQQLRYQPPLVEWFPNNVPIKHYVSNVYSNTTPNLAWYWGQPVATFWPQNWGFWLMGGYCGAADNATVLRIYDDPMVQEGEQANCPFQAFFPRPIVNCGCGYGSKAYMLWISRDVYGYVFDEIPFLQMGSDNAAAKYFGPNTRFKIGVNISTASPGDNITRLRFRVGVNTGRTGFIATPAFFVVDRDFVSGGASTGSVDINLMEALNGILPWYKIGGVDAIHIIFISLEVSTSANWECFADWDGHVSTVPAHCTTDVICKNPDMTATIDYIKLDEEEIVGDPVNDYPD